LTIRYNQAHKPIVEQEGVEGHSVRAMYLLTALADLVRLNSARNAVVQDQALKRLWSNMVDKKMSLTGGIGAAKKWEGFGIDYFLPQGTDEGGCYNETCAAIGVMMLAERLLQVILPVYHTYMISLLIKHRLILIENMLTSWNFVSSMRLQQACQVAVPTSPISINLHQAMRIFPNEKSGSPALAAHQM
jgi:hypothetical protein